RHCFVRETVLFQVPIQNEPVIDSYLEPLEADCLEQVVNDQYSFNVRGVASRADRVEIALPELPVAPALRVLAAPDRSHMVALERSSKLADVLRREACEWNSKVES